MDTPALLQQALSSYRQRDFAAAAESCDAILRDDAQNFDALHLRGTVAFQVRDYERAVDLIARAVAVNPNSASALLNLGNGLRALARPSDALAVFDRLVELDPRSVQGYIQRGIVLLELNRPAEALLSYERAVALKPDSAVALQGQGNALAILGRLDEALQCFDNTLAHNPENAEAHNNRGNVLRDLRRPDEALIAYDKAIAIRPDYEKAHNNRGNALMDLRRFPEALASYDHALALKPTNARAHNNRGNALVELNRARESLDCYDKAVSLDPGYAEAYYNRGNAFLGLGQSEEALASYEASLSRDSGNALFFSTTLDMRMRLSDWRDFSHSIERLKSDIRAAALVTPFSALGLIDEPDLQKQAGARYVAALAQATTRAAIVRAPERDRIRVGYYASAFGDHPVAHLIADMLETHDRAKFDTFGFSFGPNKGGAMRQRLSSALTQFHDVAAMSDGTVAQLSRDLGIDIAIDLNGYSENSRPGIFAEGCAPVQVNYLGYSATMGAPFIDYILADRTVIPPNKQGDFSEKVAYLPHTFFVTDTKRNVSPHRFTRAELGLPETGFVFCCFNKNYKILPAMFDVWMRLLKSTEGSVLWLLRGDPRAVENLRKEAVARGVDGDRLIFADPMPLDRHLARHSAADLLLDTLPYNAHVTTNDALWMGLPVLTCPGKSFVSRVAASLLYSVGLPELVANSIDAYEAKALSLAGDPARLSAIRRKLAVNKFATPLFNTEQFTRHLEAAYTTMHARQRAGLPPESFVVNEA